MEKGRDVRRRPADGEKSSSSNRSTFGGKGSTPQVQERQVSRNRGEDIDAAPAKKKNGIENKKCITPEFRVSFPSVFEPKAFEGQEAKYSITMLFGENIDLGKAASGSTNSMKRIAHAAAVEKWGPDKEKWPRKLRMPFRDGDEKQDLEGYAGHIYVTASSKAQPGLIDQSKRPILNERDFYPGCYARAELIAFAYDKAGNRGVSFSLQNIQKLRDGDSFSGRKNAEDVFEAVEDADREDDYYDGDDQEESTVGGDDDEYDLG